MVSMEFLYQCAEYARRATIEAEQLSMQPVRISVTETLLAYAKLPFSSTGGIDPARVGHVYHMDRGSSVLEGMRVCVSGKMGRSVCATVTVVLSLSCFGLFSAAQTVPAFVWGSGDYINHPARHAGLQTSYEVIFFTFITCSVHLT